MQVISWNIQAAKGVDEVTSVDRIADVIQAMGDADIICCQEVLCVEGDNQAQAIAARFPQHTACFGPAIDRISGDGRLRFGNLVLCRLPLLQTVMHKLPQPPEPTAKHMPRQATEVLVDYHGECIRIVTTHLEYFAARQRRDQVRYLADHHRESAQRFRQPSPQGGELQFQSLPETAKSIYCGDFNLTVGSSDYQHLCTGEQALVDCWTLLHDDQPHAPTCGIFDHVQWPEGAHCRDFFFVSGALAGHVAEISVDVDTAASDHQPVKLVVTSHDQ